MSLLRLRQTISGKPDAQRNVRYVKIYTDDAWADFCLRLYVNEAYIPDADYRTGDMGDALDTANAMVLNSTLFNEERERQ